MRKYIAFFRMRFAMGLQYRAAALGGLICQFFWGAMAILAFKAFYDTDPAAFPMSLPAMSSYIWLQQALLHLLSLMSLDPELLDLIQSGNVAYELCRPVGVYPMWFARGLASRASGALLRCVPVLVVAAFIPAPYGLMAPPDAVTFLWFLLSLLLGALVVTALGMVVAMITFHTINPRGVRLIAIGIADFCSGGIVPLPFFPEGVREIVELLPFSSTANVPLRIYSGDLCGEQMLFQVALQVFWVIALVALGRLLEYKELKNVTVQGG